MYLYYIKQWWVWHILLLALLGLNTGVAPWRWLSTPETCGSGPVLLCICFVCADCWFCNKTHHTSRTYIRIVQEEFVYRLLTLLALLGLNTGVAPWRWLSTPETCGSGPVLLCICFVCADCWFCNKTHHTSRTYIRIVQEEFVYRLLTSTARCVTSQKKQGSICTATETWNLLTSDFIFVRSRMRVCRTITHQNHIFVTDFSTDTCN